MFQSGRRHVLNELIYIYIYIYIYIHISCICVWVIMENLKDSYNWYQSIFVVPIFTKTLFLKTQTKDPRKTTENLGQ
ncbi:unnamed protein product, partial [Vitis vinifera]|uniref:Uncharacterized protein n=1 Tax=Vitis vinifera TaxID=29760 RepID=E0CW21_VITVI